MIVTLSPEAWLGAQDIAATAVADAQVDRREGIGFDAFRAQMAERIAKL